MHYAIPENLWLLFEQTRSVKDTHRRFLMFLIRKTVVQNRRWWELDYNELRKSIGSKRQNFETYEHRLRLYGYVIKRQPFGPYKAMYALNPRVFPDLVFDDYQSDAASPRIQIPQLSAGEWSARIKAKAHLSSARENYFGSCEAGMENYFADLADQISVPDDSPYHWSDRFDALYPGEHEQELFFDYYCNRREDTCYTGGPSARRYAVRSWIAEHLDGRAPLLNYDGHGNPFLQAVDVGLKVELQDSQRQESERVSCQKL